MLTANDFLLALRRRGAVRVSRVVFRENRSTVWSLTQRGTVLNVHAAYRLASSHLLDAFATLAREGGIESPESQRAAHEVSSWPELTSAIRQAREAHHARNESNPDGGNHTLLRDRRPAVLP